MKRLFALVLFYFIALSTYAQWSPAEGVFGIRRLEYHIIKDKNTFWVSTTSGIYYSKDDAVSWNRHTDLPGPQRTLPTNIARKDNDLYVVFTSEFDSLSYYRPTLYKSVDDGQSWKEVMPDSTFNSIRFFTSLSVIQGKLVVFMDDWYGGIFIFSEDDGRTWKKMKMPLLPIRSQWDSTTIVGGNSIGLHLTRDLGTSWSIIPGTEDIGRVSLVKDSIIVAYGASINGKIPYKISKDLGQHWEIVNIEGQTTHDQRLFHIDSNGIIYTHERYDPKQVYYSADKGSSWLLKGSFDTFIKPGLETSDGSGLRYRLNRLEKLDQTDLLWKNSVNGIRNGTVNTIFTGEQYVFIIQNDEELWRKPVWGNTWELIRRFPYFNNGIPYHGLVWEDKVYIASENALLRISDNGSGVLDTVLTYPPALEIDFIQTLEEFLIFFHYEQALWRISKPDFMISTVPKPESYGSSIITDDNYFYILSATGRVWRSEKDNINWTVLFEDTDPSLNNSRYTLYAYKDQLMLFGPQKLSIYSKQNGAITYVTDGGLRRGFNYLPSIVDFAVDSDTIFAATNWNNHSILKSLDGGTTWSAYNEGLDSLFILSLEITPTKQLLTGSLISGLWELPGVLTSTQNAGIAQRLSIFPNPANGLFSLNRAQEDSAQLLVYDALGHCLRTITVSGYSPQVDLSGLPAGVYHLVLSDSGSTSAGMLLLGR